MARGGALFAILLALMTPALSAGVPTRGLDGGDFSDVVRLGGDTTILLHTPTAAAFQNPAQNLSSENLEKHFEGDKIFERKFSDVPSSPTHGLGPVFNNHSCIGCHVLDGRGALPVLGDGKTWTKLGLSEAVFLRISIEPESATTDATGAFGAPLPVPGFGTQLFHLGVYGVRDDWPGTGQAQVFVRLEKSSFVYPDGATVELSRPVFKVENPYDGPNSRLFQSDVRFSPRLTPPMTGLGLIEAIPEADILALAARDLSAWGVHGKANFVYDLEKDRRGDPNPVSLGRFGHKASTPSVFQQAIGAFNGDMGVTSPAMPVESIWGTDLFERFKQKWNPGVDIDEATADTVVFYSRTLAVPSRRDVSDEHVRAGARLFTRVGCAVCHQPQFTTGPSPIAELSDQLIYPFSDFLLHDMGPGLADGRRDFAATGREWRTRALWGIGLTQVVNPRAGFLHDGRARTLEEAVLWHDGEAARSRAEFAALRADQRADLIRFLKSL